MWDYIIAILGFVILFALKIYLSYRANENKKFLYENPHELANAILVKKKREMGDMLQKIYDPNQLNLLLVRNLTVLNAEWENHLKQNHKDCGVFSERMRQIAIFLNIMLIQHEKDSKPDLLNKKMEIVGKTINKYRPLLSKINDDMGEGKYWSKAECKTISNYYLDIIEIFDKNRN